jgi:protein phosphatase
VLPVPALVLLVGVSGSGKSSFARRHFAPTEVLSSDACRAMVCDDPADQSANAAAFGLLRYLTRRRLAGGHLTVIDATNVQPRSRRPAVMLAGAFGIPAVAVILDLPLELCIARAQARLDRPVRPAVIADQHADLLAGLDSLAQEGFSVIHHMRQSDVDSAVVIRQRFPDGCQASP